MQFIRDVRDGGHYDLAVCGAGPGGVGAAVTAARLGKKVLLIEAAGCLGGYLTSGLMGIALDMRGKGGLPREVNNALLSQGQAQWAEHRGYLYSSYTYDIESMKLKLEEMAINAGVDVLLYTRVTAVKMEGRRIIAILADGFQAHAFTADYWVDGTGHGTLAEMAGCSYELGHGDGLQQPASLEALVTGVPEDQWKSDVHNPEIKRRLRQMMLEAGVDCTYSSPLLFQLSPGSLTYKFAVNHAYHVSAEEEASVTRGTLEARKEIARAAAALRTHHGWERFRVVQTAEQLGLRDSRRVRGLSYVTAEDALAGRCFEDSVAPVHFALDVHRLTPDYKPSEKEKNYCFRPFTIPMGCLIARDVDNLFLVGRCISGDFLAHSAYRTVNTAMALGEAAGVAAAMLPSNGAASAVDGKAVHREMTRRGYDFSPDAK